jgi:hypothetical protein
MVVQSGEACDATMASNGISGVGLGVSVAGWIRVADGETAVVGVRVGVGRSETVVRATAIVGDGDGEGVVGG